MKFITSFLLATYAAAVAAGPFTITYWEKRNCKGRASRCSNVSAFVCCNAPRLSPPAAWRTARVTSAGTPGVVIFTKPKGRGCGVCRSTGSINTCYQNFNPFDTMFVASIGGNCAKAALAANDVSNALAATEKQSIPEADQSDSECKEYVLPDTVTVDGVDYGIAGPNQEAVLADFYRGSDDKEFASKWADLSIAPSSATEV